MTSSDNLRFYLLSARSCHIVSLLLNTIFAFLDQNNLHYWKIKGLIIGFLKPVKYNILYFITIKLYFIILLLKSFN